MYVDPPLRWRPKPKPFYPIYEAKRANFKAVRIRRAIGRMYERNPDQALAHVNALLDRASRTEEYRAAQLEAVE